jgi:glycerophosphoryl diester phosphodiesterase
MMSFLLTTYPVYRIVTLIVLLMQSIAFCYADNSPEVLSKIPLKVPLEIESLFTQRPINLVKNMDNSALKNKLMGCSKQSLKPTNFSISHRGAPLYFPEHTKESYIAAAKMGAGIIECDVTFTKDRTLVCRHSQCDLHTTTNILATPLKNKCSTQFQPAVFNPKTKDLVKSATAKCCTSDLTLAEFKSLKGRIDSSNPRAKTALEYLDTQSDSQSILYSGAATLLTHAESISLFKKLGVGFIPELKNPEVEMPYEGEFTQAKYAQQLIDEYKTAGVNPNKVWLQSFNPGDLLYWIIHEPEFGKQAILLDGRFNFKFFDQNNPKTWILSMQFIASLDINIIAPPIWVLLTQDGNKIIPSIYAKKAKEAGLEIIPWTLERSGSLTSGGGFYYKGINSLINNDGDVYDVLHILSRDVGIKGIFSDWPSTVTYYANCIGL